MDLAERHPTGRHTKLTTATQEALVAAVRRGNSFANSAALAGIGERTFYRWMEFGESDEEGSTEFRQFWQAITRANAEFLDEAVQALQEQYPKDFRASLAVLERRERGAWGRQDTLNVTHGGTVRHEHEHVAITTASDQAMQRLQGIMTALLPLPTDDDETVEGEFSEVEQPAQGQGR